MDSKVLESRLLNRSSTVGGFGGTSISKCVTKFQSLQSESDCDSFLRELLSYQFEMSKVNRLIHSCEKEINDYVSLEESAEMQIQLAESNINALEKKLINCQQIRRHRESCESMATSVNQFQSTQSVSPNLYKIEESLIDLSLSISQLDETILARSNQFQTLFQAIQLLETPLVETVQENDTSNED